MVAELDTLAQASAYQDAPTAADFDQEILTRIRTALVLAGRLLATDVMVLDSPFFTRYPPAKLAAALGLGEHQLPLTILSRHPNLQIALDARRDDPDFVWQLTAIDGTGHLHPATDAWKQWIDAAAGGYVGFIRQTAQPAGPFVRHEPPDELVSPSSDHAAELLSVAREASGRTAVWTKYTACTAELGSSPEALDECRRIWRWWNHCYLRRIAQLHGAHWVAFDAPPDAEDAPEWATHRISAHLIRHMRTQSPGRFSLALHRAEGARKAFHEDPGRRELRNVSYAATAEPSPDSPITMLFWLAVKVVSAALIVAGYLLSIDQLPIDLAWWVPVLLGAAGTVISAVPQQEIRDWWTLRDKDRSAVIETLSPT